MASDFDSAVRAGAMAAGRLHRRLDTQALIGRHGGNVDVFGAIHAVDLPLLLRPLKGLLGAYLSSPAPGVLVTTERPMNIQRFTAAHELGHFFMRHEPSLDDESILRRMPMSPEPGNQFQETEADAFAIAFMMPKWLIALHCARQGWTVDELRRPNIAYQLSLRIGASYEATCRTLYRYKLISDAVMRELLETKPRSLKVDLLHDYRPADYRGDVWLLSERDEGARIDGSRNDLFVLRLKEHAGGGFLWDLDQLMASGFAVVRDEREAFDPEAIGGPVVRRVCVVDAHRVKRMRDGFQQIGCFGISQMIDGVSPTPRVDPESKDSVSLLWKDAFERRPIFKFSLRRTYRRSRTFTGFKLFLLVAALVRVQAVCQGQRLLLVEQVWEAMGR